MDSLKKIRSMTTDIGIYQHGKLSEPNPEFGYALEDQARALIVANEFKDDNLKGIYLNFKAIASNKTNKFGGSRSGSYRYKLPPTIRCSSLSGPRLTFLWLCPLGR